MKVKGLEYRCVVLANDFAKIFTRRNQLNQFPNLAEEFSLIYVAATRATEALFLNDTLYSLMAHTNGHIL